nr:MAG TPA: hypothetical protein [Caudoviricetes sp.]
MLYSLPTSNFFISYSLHVVIYFPYLMSILYTYGSIM